MITIVNPTKKAEKETYILSELELGTLYEVIALDQDSPSFFEIGDMVYVIRDYNGDPKIFDLRSGIIIGEPQTDLWNDVILEKMDRPIQVEFTN